MPSVSPRVRRRRLTVLVALVAALGCVALLVSTAVHAGTANTVASVTSLTPASGSITGNHTVTVTGNGLDAVAKVAFGPTTVTVRLGSSDGKVVVNAPAAPNYQAAAVKVTLLDKNGKPVSTADKTYTYTAASGVDKQLQYALAHWKDYNTAEYGDLNPVGGDCANFVSQTLIARGWAMNDDWYNHDAADDWSPAWGYVPAMDNYFADDAAQLGLQKLTFGQRKQVALGDIAIFDWDDDGSPDHVQVVTAIKKVGGKTLIEMASHNDDFAYRDLDQILTVSHPGASGHFWHLTR